MTGDGGPDLVRGSTESVLEECEQQLVFAVERSTTSCTVKSVLPFSMMID
jgi:hypothetical protein